MGFQTSSIYSKEWIIEMEPVSGFVRNHLLVETSIVIYMIFERNRANFLKRFYTKYRLNTIFFSCEKMNFQWGQDVVIVLETKTNMEAFSIFFRALSMER